MKMVGFPPEKSVFQKNHENGGFPPQIRFFEKTVKVVVSHQKVVVFHHFLAAHVNFGTTHDSPLIGMCYRYP